MRYRREDRVLEHKDTLLAQVGRALSVSKTRNPTPKSSSEARSKCGLEVCSTRFLYPVRPLNLHDRYKRKRTL